MTIKYCSDESHPTGISRRRFLRSVTATFGAVGLGGLAQAGSSGAQGVGLPDPAASGIEHIVVVMMENRSFDHFSPS